MPDSMDTGVEAVEGTQGRMVGGHQIGEGRPWWVSELLYGFKVFLEMTGPTTAMEVLGQGTDGVFYCGEKDGFDVRRERGQKAS